MRLISCLDHKVACIACTLDFCCTRSHQPWHLGLYIPFLAFCLQSSVNLMCLLSTCADTLLCVFALTLTNMIFTPALQKCCLFILPQNFLYQKISQKISDGYSDPSDNMYVPINICTYIYLYVHTYIMYIKNEQVYFQTKCEQVYFQHNT